MFLNIDYYHLLYKGVAVVLTIILGSLLSLLLKKILGRLFAKSRRINDLMGKFLLKIIKVVIWVVIALVALRQVGVDMAPLLATLGITGFILGFAFQETLGNLLAGVMIVLNAPFRIGDYVEIGALSGTVKDMDMMSVTLSTPDNKRVIMANKLIWGQAIINYSYTASRRIEMGLSISPSSDVEKAKEIIFALLESYPEVLQEPKIFVGVTQHTHSSVDIVVRPWSKPGDYWSVYFRFQQEILAKFKEAGIELPIPQMRIDSSKTD
ncbi:MAG: mechanosensitive ion channel family protein [Sphaerochaetaceae bacterium]